MSNIENWKPVVGYEGLYEVSDWGRVRSLDKYIKNWPKGIRLVKGRVLKPGRHRKGYLLVVLNKDGVMKTCKVHRLVAIAFIPNPDGLPQVNHKDENKHNNRVENLEWCDNKYNICYSQAMTVYMYTLNDSLCGMWPSTMECGRLSNFNQSAIVNCCNKKLKQYKGFKWSYEPPKPLLSLPYYP